jgi:phage repressor protein C with HTH and peptisase S24 domain
MSALKDRLRLAMDGPPAVSQAELARAAGVKAHSVSDWLSGRTKNLEGSNLLAAAKALGVNAEWLATGRGPMKAGSDVAVSRYRIAEATEDSGAESIEFSNARGSCGGGSMSWDDDYRQPLLKEPSWFRRYQVKPRDALAVWADGDSMANFIVDGDIAIFDTSKKTPKSGMIFLIDHPDGLRIKRLRREIDGSWILESDNPDKRRFPDERVGLDQLDLLRICGQFVYRQGG